MTIDLRFSVEQVNVDEHDVQVLAPRNIYRRIPRLVISTEVIRGTSSYG